MKLTDQLVEFQIQELVQMTEFWNWKLINQKDKELTKTQQMDKAIKK